MYKKIIISGNLPGIGWRPGITGDFTFETADYYPATGGNLFSVCQKWSDGSFVDLVGISNY